MTSIAQDCSRYDASGRLLGPFRLQPEIIDMLRTEQGQFFVEGHFDEATTYVVDGVAVARPANPARLDGMTLRDLPVPCVIVIDGERYDCTDDHAELEFVVPKTYQIRIEAFPLQDATFEVTIP